ncbi:MAG: M61 family metallopeptidase [Acidobacteria bacterium]|nr:M61 family metallopeptidase [Acidobacteriota bacterium]
MPRHSSKDPIRALLRPLALAQHELEVELLLPADLSRQGPLMSLPAWTPGSYLIRDYARLLDRVELRDARGRRWPVEKVDKQSWKLPPLKGEARLSYRLFCNELTVRTNHMDATHAHLVGAATFLHSRDELDRPYQVNFEGFPSSWDAATSLPERRGALLAEDYDTLVDSPIELGTFRRHAFRSLGSTFEVAITGPHRGDEGRILEGTRKIVDVCGSWFGGFPFRRYVFLLTFSPGARGGLEHRSSTSLLQDPFALEEPQGYHDLFTLVAHEFFHAWNVKRIKDRRLDRFDYSRENHSRLLWFHEGLTSYLQHLVVMQAGLVPFQAVARSLAGTWGDYAQRAGMREQSLEESSFDAWIRQYKPNEFSPNSTVGYYDKGSLVGWLMDAHIRLGSGGRRNLVDLFRRLWEQKGEGGISDGEIRSAFAELTGEDPGAFWDAYIAGRETLPADPIERAFGLRFERGTGEATDVASTSGPGAWAGFTVHREEPSILNVVPGGPAWKAGLSYGMEVLAVDGWRVDSAPQLRRRVQGGRPGGTVEVLAATRGRVGAYRLRLEEAPPSTIRIAPDARATKHQRDRFEAWSGQPFPRVRARVR